MKIVVDVVNSEKVKDLTAEIKKQETQIAQWNTAMKAGTMTQAQFEASSLGAAKAIQTAKVQLAEIPQAAGAAGRGLGQLAYAVDDIQYGFSAIVNNIPGIVMGMGMSAGIAGAAGIAAVAINQLYKHWAELADIASGMWAGSSIEQLTQLREKAEEATKAFEKLAETPTKAKAAAAAGVAGLITEGPTDKILKDTAEAIAQDPSLKAKMEREKPNELANVIADALGLMPAEDDPRHAKALDEQAKKEAQEKNVQKAKELLGAAAQGDEHAMRTLQGLAERHPGNFPPEFIQDIKDQTPEGQKRIEQQRLEAQGERNARKMGEEEKARLEKEKEEQNKLEIQGRKNARASDKETAIRSLEDERKQVMRNQHDFDEQMWQRQHEATQGAVMAGGAKSLIDLYQSRAAGKDDPKELAKQAHAQREKTNKHLQVIEDKLKETRRFGPQN